jgi:ABC-type molybdate transport system permease subunit
MVMAAPRDNTLPNSLIDSDIHPTIPADCILSFARKTGEFDTTIKVPVGYRDGKIWIVGIKKIRSKSGMGGRF